MGGRLIGRQAAYTSSNAAFTCGTVPLDWVAIAERQREAVLSERRRIKAEKEDQRRLADERAEQNRKAAQKREAEETPTPVFETNDSEVASRLSEAYRPAFVRIMKSGATYRVEDPERYGKQIAIAVQSERQELRKQNADPDKVFAKRREEHAEILAAR